ncbi:ABC transporter ATP-binding protein [Tepidibacter formicigenes]|jgi:oligopeptide transport system ATP-binding protein|uniref:Oligopeptide transport system ATP-binding protein n=1 Tax=Tepidibacter formicigenes DSM 15518 TaxID=1123349 RepID=A0A1M6JJH1_9FIRM|nr:ABC transporter ATP-binding protein [Tepidibacter formicigenes]SHJ46881.1 oligopeptide transport system ATP-binding protein [Tepidibacter formicigenes DSM 15518]
MGEKLLEVKNLRTSFFTHVGEVKAIRGVSFHVDKGEALGIVGESGSGKSVTSMSVMRLLQHPGKIIGGEILFNGEDLIKKSEKDMQGIRGNDISMIFQDPMTSLNPVYTVGDQIMEAIIKHQKLSKADAKKKAIEMLRLVGIPSPEKRVNQYPHEFSGGMRQRAMIAMALSCEPQLLIADEPTTALDVTIQAQILELMKDLKNKLNTSIMLITHDLGVVADVCSRIIVMYGGLIMEEGSTDDIFYNPKHPYTLGLLKSVPKLTDKENKEKLIPIPGSPPDLLKPPKGCPFAARCEYAMKVCMEKMPEYTYIKENHRSMCWLLHPDAPRVDEINGNLKEGKNNE